MDFLKVLLTSVGSVAALFIMTKIIGNKQINQLNLFDYINGITIGSIGAELAITPEKEFYQPLTALVIYTLATFSINLISMKSIKCRRFLEGKSRYLMKDGKLYNENIKKANLDLNEFLTQCRVMGFYDLSDINTAIIEPNGKVSILPNDNARPVTPKDMGLSVQQTKVQYNVIMDGCAVKENLKSLGYDESWLSQELSKQKTKMSEVFLATCDIDGNLNIYDYNKGYRNDPFL